MTEIAYYPEETPLFDGDVELAKVDDPESATVHHVYVPELGLRIGVYSSIARPLRTQHTGYPLNQVGEVITCNVDLELSPQPSMDAVARAILAEYVSH